MPGRPLTLASVADGAEGLVVCRSRACRRRARRTRRRPALAVVCRDGPRMAALARALGFFAPTWSSMQFPAWDCLPYDRVSPHAGFVAQRMTALSRLVRVKGRDARRSCSPPSTPSSSACRRATSLRAQALSVAPGNMLAMDGIIGWLELNGFVRASTVREPGDYAVRGGIIDLYPPGMAEPVRLDFFGDTLETIRSFDPETPAHHGSVARARSRAGRGIPAHDRDHPPLPHGLCGGVRRRRARRSPLHAVSEGRRHPGMEHWLPLFHDRLDTLFDYCRARRSCWSRSPRTPRASGLARSRTITTRGSRRSRSADRVRLTSRCRRTGSI